MKEKNVPISIRSKKEFVKENSLVRIGIDRFRSL
jgi:hypothetical protein